MRFTIDGVGKELNPILIPFIDDPFIFGLIKVAAFIIEIGLMKFIYEFIHIEIYSKNKSYIKYNILIIYAYFFPLIITSLFIVINNLMIISIVRGLVISI